MVQLRKPDVLNKQDTVYPLIPGAKKVQDCTIGGFISRNMVWKFLQKSQARTLGLQYDTLSLFFPYPPPTKQLLLSTPSTFPFSFYHISNQWKLFHSEVNPTLLVLNSWLAGVNKLNFFLEAFKIKCQKLVGFWGVSISFISYSWI